MIAVLAAAATPAQAQPYTWSTVIGVAGRRGSIDGTNAGGLVANPTGLATDNAGGVYLTDAGTNNTIRKITRVGADYVITTLAGFPGPSGNISVDGTNSGARFMGPYALTMDTTGTVYVAENSGSRVRKLSQISTNWVATTLAGSSMGPDQDGTNNSASFSLLRGITRDAMGRLFVTDGGNLIRMVMSVGTNWVVTTVAGGAGSSTLDGTNTAARFAGPYGIVVDNSSNLFVAEAGGNVIRKITPIGTNWVVTTVAGLAGVSGSADGTNSDARFFTPKGLTIDPTGNLYVTEENNHAIRRIRSVGTNWIVTTLGGFPGSSGTTDGTGAAARFDTPRAIAVDTNGDLFVADFAAAVIRFGKFIPSLQFTRSADQLVLQWPMLATNYVLETSGSLNTNANWSPASPPVAFGEDFVSTNALYGTNSFFRLRK